MTIIVQKRFCDFHIEQPIFASLKEDYTNFHSWFQRKKYEPIHVVYWQQELAAVLYLKIEEQIDEAIEPKMEMKKRMKVGTFKVEKEGLGIGRNLLEYVDTQARRNEVCEIYLTVFEHGAHHRKFIAFIEQAGFIHYGYKNEERVYIKTIKNE